MVRIISLIYPLILLALFSLLFFFSLGKPVVLDYDEGAYAEVSREMYTTSQLLLPTLNGEDFFEYSISPGVKTLFKKADSLLKMRMDKIIVQFKENNPDFLAT